MTGSRRWFNYIGDDGNTYALEADESNTELVNPAEATASIAVNTRPLLPSRTRPRFVRISNSDGTVTRKCYVLRPTDFAALNNATEFILVPPIPALNQAQITGTVTTKVGETTKRLPRLGDSALNDGDVP